MEKFIQSTKTRPGADCGSDHELLIEKFRLRVSFHSSPKEMQCQRMFKLPYIEENRRTTRPFMCDLNQTPYDSTVKVRNRFRG